MEKHQEQSQNASGSQEIPGKIELLQQLKASESSESEESYFQVVVIAYDSELYGIRILSVREILKVTKITWLPCTPEYISGVISVRGDIQSVVNLKRFLQLGHSRVTEHSRIILVESGELIAGLLVDEMVDIVDVPESALHPFTELSVTITRNYVDGKISWNDKTITLLNMDEVIQGVVVDQT